MRWEQTLLFLSTWCTRKRRNPLISDENQRLTREIGTYHEKALNKIGSLYYSEEDYDDFFFGKGFYISRC